MEETNTLVARILTCLETLEAFYAEDYNAVVQSALGFDRVDILAPCKSPLFGEDLGEVLDRFKVETIAYAIAQSPQHGFAHAVHKKSLGSKIAQSASKVVCPIFRKYLEDHLRGEIPDIDLLALTQDNDFCYAWLHNILDTTFLENIIRRFDDQPQYCTALAYIYERTRPNLQTMSNRFIADASSGRLIPLPDIAQKSLPGVAFVQGGLNITNDSSGSKRSESLLEALAPVA